MYPYKTNIALGKLSRSCLVVAQTTLPFSLFLFSYNFLLTHAIQVLAYKFSSIRLDVFSIHSYYYHSVIIPGSYVNGYSGLIYWQRNLEERMNIEKLEMRL